MYNIDTFVGILQEFFDEVDVERKIKRIEIRLVDMNASPNFIKAFHNLKIKNGCEKVLKVWHHSLIEELKDVPDDIKYSIEVNPDLINFEWQFSTNQSLKLFLTAKGQVKLLNFQ